MSPLVISVFFGGGVAAFAYTRIGRRVGYGNTRDVWTVIGVIFILSALFCFTIMKYTLGF